MTNFVRDVRIWDKLGVLRQSARFDGAINEQRTLAEKVDAHVQRGLAGQVVEVPYESGADSLDCTFAPLVDAEGRPDGVVAISVDAVERRRTATTLRERLAFEELITSLSTQLVSVSLDAVDQAVGAALRAIGEFARVDRAYVFRFTPDGAAMNNTHEWCGAGIESILETMQDLPLEVFPWWTTRLLRDRVVIHLDVQALPPEAEAERATLTEQGVKSILCLPMIYEGVVVGFLGFDAVRATKRWPDPDVALLRIAGEILVSALERKEAERRRRLMEAELIQARSLENVTRLAGGVAHDFNNLLSVVLNYAAILRSELVEPEQQAKMTELYGAALRAAELTRRLLQIGRRAIDAPVLLDVNTVVTALSPLVKQALGESVELRLELDDDLGLVRIGLPQLEQVFLNLALNARDAMPHGGVLVIETKEIEMDPGYAAKFIDVKLGQYLRLRVKDTGSGMTADVASRAFEPFFTTKEEEGTGLGLSTVHGIVKQGGGHVTLASAPGDGTTLDVFLPIVRDGVAAELEPPPRGAAPKGRGERVLLVEDGAAVRKVICDMIRSNGYRVLEAATAHEALEMLEQHRGAIDLVLTDLIMPQMSGRDLAVRAKRDYGVSRVLYMSGYPDEIIAHHGVVESDGQLLQKPFLEADLLRALRKVIDAG